ncbi:MAG: leucine-rich repeat domain-containing protein, partial [Ureaplasma sp.]|nr:leucine-rich repeat domain-containing protein [Ureaplasma sp.]
FKYSVSSNNNVVVENGSLVVKNLTYYLDLTISDENLQQLWTNLNNYIIENEISIGNGGDIGNYLNYGIYNLFKNVVTEQNGKLEQFINAPTSIGTSNLTTLTGARDIKVTLKNGLYKMNSKNLDNDSYLENYNIVVSNNSLISMNNLYLSSPSSYFNWDNTNITSISSEGLNEQFHIIPYKAKSFSQAVYYNNRTIKGIDMSFSNILVIPASTTPGGSDKAFICYCFSLLTLYLPKNLKEVGSWGISYSSINELIVPDSVNRLGRGCFYGSGSSGFIRNLTLGENINNIPDICYYNNSSTVTSLVIKTNLNLSFLTSRPFVGNFENVRIYVKTSYNRDAIINLNISGLNDSNVIIE